MEIEKYKSLKTKIRDKSFEINFKSLDKGLFTLSFLGNAGAIFFAFFLLNPALQKTITEHVSGSVFFTVVGMMLAIIILVGVEYVKRNVFRIFSAEFIESSFKLFKGSVFAFLISSIIVFAASFYFSVTGGIQFSKLSEKKNEVIQKTNKSAYDSISKVSENSKLPIIAEINNLRESNKTLRAKRDDTPLNYRSARNEYTQLITNNDAIIESKQEEIKQIDGDLKTKITELKKAEVSDITKNEDSDFSSILLFIIISVSSEFLIIVGIYFRELYEHKAFYENEPKLDTILKKRVKYEHLLKIVYKNGEVMAEEQVISGNKLVELMKNKGGQYPFNFIKDFYLELTNLNVFRVTNNKRYALVSYDEAKKMLDYLV